MQLEDYIINGFSLDDIRNIYEIRVINQMKLILPEFTEFDGCQNCLRDVYALALSRIPATYALGNVNLSGEELQEDEINGIVKYAIYQVMQHPKHS